MYVSHTGAKMTLISATNDACHMDREKVSKSIIRLDTSSAKRLCDLDCAIFRLGIWIFFLFPISQY